MTILDGNRNTRINVDWDKAKRDYLIGVKSNELIAKENQILTKTGKPNIKWLLTYAKTHGWIDQRGDLRDKFLSALRARQLQEYKPPADPRGRNIAPSNTKALEDQETAIEAMAEAAAGTIREHRTDLSKLRGIVKKLTDRVDAYMDGNPIEILTKKGEWIEAPFMGNRESISAVIETISRIHTRVQGLERIAFGIDKKEAQDPLTVTFSKDDESV